MINSSLFQTINNSLTYLAEFFDKYNAVLPFAKISPKLAGLLPNQIYEKRLFYRRKYLLPQDDVEINENTTFYENEKKYEEILLSVLEELYEGLNTSKIIVICRKCLFHSYFLRSFPYDCSSEDKLDDHSSISFLGYKIK